VDKSWVCYPYREGLDDCLPRPVHCTKAGGASLPEVLQRSTEFPSFPLIPSAKSPDFPRSAYVFKQRLSIPLVSAHVLYVQMVGVFGWGIEDDLIFQKFRSSLDSFFAGSAAKDLPQPEGLDEGTEEEPHRLNRQEHQQQY